MGKKDKSLLNFKKSNIPKVSQFNAFADKIYKAKQKNREKLHETRQKVLARSGTKGRILKAKKANKFSLLDDDNEQYNNFITHKGKRIQDIEAFNDVQFGDHSDNDQDFKNAQSQLQFTGFDQTKPKSKTDVYKEIIQKSKMYKHERQMQYEQNYTSAVDLDNKIEQLIPNLKFQSKANRLQYQMQGRDLEYERLIKQLEQDERIVPQKNLQRKKKQTHKNKLKKVQQLRELMKQDSDDEDIRGWVQQQGQNQEQQQDQLDNVQLSSDQQQGQQQSGEEQLQDEDLDGSQNEQGNQDEQDQDQDEQDQAEQDQGEQDEGEQKSLNNNEEDQSESDKQDLEQQYAQLKPNRRHKKSNKLNNKSKGRK